MAYKQTRNFDRNKMGTRKGWCLMNCRLGFGIPKGTYPSAKVDMETQRKNGTLHPISEIPTNCAVPVYCDTSSKYEHVVVYDHGSVYSDGKLVHGGLSAFKCFGWGECCDGERVVEWTADPVPVGFLPEKGYWGLGDSDPRIAELAFFMRSTFPAYTDKRALGPIYGRYLKASIVEFQRRTGLVPDGNTGPLTFAKLREFGFYK